MPQWLQEAHELYLIMQAAPRYEPDEEELSDFKLKVIAQIHALYERIRLELLTR